MAKTKKPRFESGKRTGSSKKPLTFPAAQVHQGNKRLYIFSAKASILYAALSINRKIENKDEGYQRTLSLSRVASIAKHIALGRPIPTSIVVAFDKSKFDTAGRRLIVPAGRDIGWVIDGQHRLAGAYEAYKNGHDIELFVVAFSEIDEKEQIQQFVTINREAKGVPTSLYLDLLRHLPAKDAALVIRERAADIARDLKLDENSPFFERIPTTVSPKAGQISLTNFVRKISPLLGERATLGVYTEKEQRAVIANYYAGLRNAFPDEFRKKDSIFFRTIGFGALWNAFPIVFNLSLKEYKGFQVRDVTRIWKAVETFEFSGWRNLGTGTAAESQAGNDLIVALRTAFAEGQTTSQLRI